VRRDEALAALSRRTDATGPGEVWRTLAARMLDMEQLRARLERGLPRPLSSGEEG